MVKIRWSNKASSDLSDVFQGVLKVSFSEELASKKIETILATISTLEKFPELGKRVKDNFIGDWSFLEENGAIDVRAITSETYWIVYDCRLADDVVDVLAISHHSRDMHRIFK